MRAQVETNALTVNRAGRARPSVRVGFDHDRDGAHGVDGQIDEGCAPAPLTIVFPTPADLQDNGRNDRCDDMTWNFDWTDVIGATEYHLFVKHQGASLAYINLEGILTSEYQKLCPACWTTFLSDWEVMVRAKVGGVWQAWSAPVVFGVEPVDTDPSNCP